MTIMPNQKCFSIMLLFLSVLSFQSTTSLAQDVISDLWIELPQAYMDYEVIEASLLIQTPEGFLYRISRVMTEEGYSVCFADSNALYNVVPIYWGQSYVESTLSGIRQMWVEVKEYVINILEKIKDMMGIVGVIVIFVCSGILTYFLNIAFPAFPAKWTFYSVFLFLCFGWIYLTSIYSSVIYASGILLVPYMLIALLGLAYRKTLGRFKRTTKNGLKA